MLRIITQNPAVHRNIKRIEYVNQLSRRYELDIDNLKRFELKIKEKKIVIR
ncbi:hypothetical protein HanRHA438_Chr14g0666461 [Helianthus annuus]|nr:hypothetical protein HanIR_Chr14g0711271 [Helianthus annuus]KAJ0854790.1 hypothetical protein HanRHA438_Chr14g0666461 [Helianthus annuus]